MKPKPSVAALQPDLFQTKLKAIIMRQSRDESGR
jgi:hypothetical protein